MEINERTIGKDINANYDLFWKFAEYLPPEVYLTDNKDLSVNKPPVINRKNLKNIKAKKTAEVNRFSKFDPRGAKFYSLTEVVKDRINATRAEKNKGDDDDDLEMDDMNLDEIPTGEIIEGFATEFGSTWELKKRLSEKILEFKKKKKSYRCYRRSCSPTKKKTESRRKKAK